MDEYSIGFQFTGCKGVREFKFCAPVGHEAVAAISIFLCLTW